MTRTIKHISAGGLWNDRFPTMDHQAKLTSREITRNFEQSLKSAEAWRIDGFAANKSVFVCLTDARSYYSLSQDSTGALRRNEAARLAVSNLSSAIGKMARESVDKDARCTARAELKAEVNATKFALEIARTTAKLELLNLVLANTTKPIVSVEVVELAEV